MKISDLFLPEFDQEMVTARNTLERIPEDKLSWKPHPKSMPLDRLAGHVAELAGWAVPAIEQDYLDFMPPGQPPFQPTIATSRKQVLEIFDKNREASRRELFKRRGFLVPRDLFALFVSRSGILQPSVELLTPVDVDVVPHTCETSRHRALDDLGRVVQPL